MAINSASSEIYFQEHLIQLDLTLHGADCPICLEDIDPRDVSFTLPCHHKFDRRCIMEWVQTGGTEDVRCPACRTAVENVIGGWDYVEELKLWMYGGLGKRYPEISRLIALQLELRLLWLERQSTRPRWLLNAHLARFPVVDSIYLIRRLLVYHFGLRSKYIGSNSISKYKEVTSSTIAKDSELAEKARRFIKRELSVLQHEMTEKDRDKYVQGVINVISSVDLKSAGGRAELLIHETLKHVSRTHADILVCRILPSRLC
ncbi:hypothetical protein BJ508DRAFT_415737 [Ascobolus immersus RN42]|uniref:RING-type domain-containing protein n=1 Tax=Ascobolus immersus RN42 TaxID=1160509 RepID=A0A3N4I0V3_ASCIM|nr:hypothetical protein BJ508DRAFT_415737 [Ascobolus immersus RN42]